MEIANFFDCRYSYLHMPPFEPSCRRALALLALVLVPSWLFAADQPIAIPLQNGQQVVLGQEQQLMLKAAQYVSKRDFASALPVYSQVLAMDGGNIEAYIQRSVVRSELNDAAGAEGDAVTAVSLSSALLAKDPNNAQLYYQRGTGYRLLKDFAHAKADINHAIQLAGGQHADWQSDLSAMNLEEKMGN